MLLTPVIREVAFETYENRPPETRGVSKPPEEEAESKNGLSLPLRWAASSVDVFEIWEGVLSSA